MPEINAEASSKSTVFGGTKTLVFPVKQVPSDSVSLFVSHETVTLDCMCAGEDVRGGIMAEGARFELAVPLRGLRFSRPARSAAPSPLRSDAGIHF